MTIVLLGASGTGKSTIEKELSAKYGFQKITSYTTRAMRDGEVNGVDYFFIDNDSFNELLLNGVFAEHEEYSQNRLYGTLKTAYSDCNNKVVVLTPNGLRQLKVNCPNDDIVSILITANLGTRIKRYIDRCGVEKFNYDDKNEIAARVERDFGAFMGVENEVDVVIHNDEGTNIDAIVSEIFRKCLEELNKKN